MFSVGLFLLVVCGKTANGWTDTVELVSLDPRNNPVPDRFKELNKFPSLIQYSGGGALFSPGNCHMSNMVGARANLRPHLR